MQRKNSIVPGGITLVELLVVIIILTTLVAGAIPLMVPAVENRRIQAAGSGVRTFITAARTRALETGRPAGVVIQSLVNEPGAGLNLFLAEVPPPYAGFTKSSRCRLTVIEPPDSNNSYIIAQPGQVISNPQLPPFIPDSIPVGLLSPGDKIQFAHQGLVYNVRNVKVIKEDSVVGKGLVELVFLDIPPKARSVNRLIALPWPVTNAANDVDLPSPDTINWSSPVSYSIRRQPSGDPTAPGASDLPKGLLRSSAAAYRLPDGTAIDLRGSGVGRNQDPGPGDEHTVFVGGSIAITFAPEGSVSHLYHFHNGSFQPERVRSTIHLLIGKRENVPPTLDEETQNWLDMNNLWVSIGHQTGAVRVSEMAPVHSTPATATANLKKERITGITLQDGGTDYLRPPAVILISQDGLGYGASAAFAIINGNGRVDEDPPVVYPGKGYITEPLVIFADMFQARRFAEEAINLGGQ